MGASQLTDDDDSPAERYEAALKANADAHDRHETPPYGIGALKIFAARAGIELLSASAVANRARRERMRTQQRARPDGVSPPFSPGGGDPSRARLEPRGDGLRHMS